MAEPKAFGSYDILEIVNLGLMDFVHSLRAVLIIAAIPSLLTVLYGALVTVDENTSQWALIAILLPANLISAPFYMALLYQISKILCLVLRQRLQSCYSAGYRIRELVVRYPESVREQGLQRG